MANAEAPYARPISTTTRARSVRSRSRNASPSSLGNATRSKSPSRRRRIGPRSASPRRFFHNARNQALRSHVRVPQRSIVGAMSG